jgi:uncharacterized protein YbjT (DUF2867 family)
MQTQPILVIGATGYVGGRLVPRLLEAGYRVRALGRSLTKLRCRPWAQHPRLELAAGDVQDPASLTKAMAGCGAAYYLVHAVNTQNRHFLETDRRAAQNLITAAAAARLGRLIYLGGLGGEGDPRPSALLQSRNEVTRILRSGPVPATILRAAMILGSGSASFEILRYLVDRLPVVFSPNWVRTPCQPISVRNVLGYLQGCLEHPETTGQTFDLGGPEVITYRHLMEVYAEEAHLPARRIIPVPLLTPRLSSYWIHLITPVPAAIARPLTEELRHPAVCREQRIRTIIPQQLSDCRETIRTALEQVRQQQVETCWTDAGQLLPPEWTACGDAGYAGGTILECGYRIRLQARPEEVWELITRVGGDTGWYFGNRLWWLRGWMDRLAGGIGLRGGRRHPSQLHTGDALDFWRVLAVEAPHRLLLLAEMKVPGEALLEFRITPLGDNQSELQQLSRFLPKGLWGIVYWYSLYPLHQLVFGGMLSSIARTLGRPVVGRAQRFTPKLQHFCRLPTPH